MSWNASLEDTGPSTLGRVSKHFLYTLDCGYFTGGASVLLQHHLLRSHPGTRLKLHHGISRTGLQLPLLIFPVFPAHRWGHIQKYRCGQSLGRLEIQWPPPTSETVRVNKAWPLPTCRIETTTCSQMWRENKLDQHTVLFRTIQLLQQTAKGTEYSPVTEEALAKPRCRAQHPPTSGCLAG